MFGDDTSLAKTEEPAKVQTFKKLSAVRGTCMYIYEVFMAELQLFTIAELSNSTDQLNKIVSDLSVDSGKDTGHRRVRSYGGNENAL